MAAFEFPCPCGETLSIPESLVKLGGKVRCPRCKAVVDIPAEVIDEVEQERAELAATMAARKEKRARVAEEKAKRRTQERQEQKERAERKKGMRLQRLEEVNERRRKAAEDQLEKVAPRELDLQKVGVWVGGAGLALLALSPLLNCIKLGPLGISGITVWQGKVVLGFTVAVAAAYLACLLTQRHVIPVLLGVQAWGTIAVLYTGGWIWRIRSLVGDLMDDTSEVEGEAIGENIGLLFAAAIAPGMGLYVGFIGGALIAGAVGYLLVRQLLQIERVQYYYISQSISCALGILLALFVGFERPTESHTEPDAVQPPLKLEAPAEEVASPPLAEAKTEVFEDIALTPQTGGFRGVPWGATMAQVKRTEKAAVHSSDSILVCPCKLAELDAYAGYVFVDDKFVRGTYIVTEQHANLTLYVNDYANLKNIVQKKYGNPTEDGTIWRDDLYKDDPGRWGMAIATGRMSMLTEWELPHTQISLMLYGDNYEIHLSLSYISKQYGHLEDEQKTQRHLDAL